MTPGQLDQERNQTMQKERPLKGYAHEMDDGGPSFIAGFAMHYSVGLYLPVKPSPEWVYYRSSSTASNQLRIRKMLNNQEFLNDLAFFLSTPDGMAEINDELQRINARTRMGYEGRNFESEDLEKAQEDEVYSPHNLEKIQQEGAPTKFEAFIKIIDQCFSDAPEQQIKDSSLIRVFTKASAKKFISNVGDDSDRLGRTWNALVSMAANNGYRRIIEPSAVIFDRLEKLKLDFPNFYEVTTDVIRQIKTWRLMKHEKRLITPILLNGKKGCGKTAYSQALADALGTPSSYLNLASTTSYTVLTGLSSKWGNGQPGMIFQELAKGESASPVVLLDEIDKISSERYMPVDSALFSLIDPQISVSLTDEFGQFQFDASRVIYIATSNDLKNIQAPIVSRFKVFQVKPPTESQKLIIIDRIAKNNYNDVAFSEGAMRLLVSQGDDLRDMTRLIDLAVGLHAESVFNNNPGNESATTNNGSELKNRVDPKSQPTQIVGELTVRAAINRVLPRQQI